MPSAVAFDADGRHGFRLRMRSQIDAPLAEPLYWGAPSSRRLTGLPLRSGTSRSQR